MSQVPEQSMVFLGALSTHQLVGRTTELEALEVAIFPPDPASFQCLIFSAAGGLGKTRLLREVYARLTHEPNSLNPNQGLWVQATSPALVLELIDLADVAIHSFVGFLREVRERFGLALTNHKAAFAAFDAAWLTYEEARDGELDFGEVNERTRLLREAFNQDYRALTSTLRVVWILDTLEQLYAVPPEIAALLEKLGITSTDRDDTTYSWLIQFIQTQPERTTLLLAGRPEPPRWLADFSALFDREMSYELKVDNFSVEETRLYMDYLCTQLARQSGFEQRARELRAHTDEDHEIANLHRLTGGNPIRLALYIDLFVNASVMPEPFSDPRSSEGLDKAAIAVLQTKLDTDLLNYLTQHLVEPEPQVIEYLSVMRRGLDKPCFKMLWGTQDDTMVEGLFDRLQRLSFIKSRGDTLFLHDEFYSIFQRHLAGQVNDPEAQEAERGRQRDIFERLIDYNQQRALDLARQIMDVQAELAGLTGEDPNYLTLKAKFRVLRAERRRFRTERVHYALYNDPEMGLNNPFFRTAGQAFLANEPDLDELLQSEITSFFFGTSQELNQIQTGVSPETWHRLRFQVLHERVSRWIRRLIMIMQRSGAQLFAVLAQNDHEELEQRFYRAVGLDHDHTSPELELVCRLYKLEWDACRCFAAVFSGENLREPLATLEQLTHAFEEALNTEDLLRNRLKELRWRTLNILAECLLFRGFAHANLYEFKKAEEIYRKADRILARTQFTTLQSDVRNGLGRVLGERGNLLEALHLCEEALDVREKNGFDYLRGLSRNTLALINTRNNRPTRAREHADIALSLFRQLNNPRGIGLALIQAAEARRRVWRLSADSIRNDRLARRKADMELLKKALELLEEAEELFTTTFRSDARRAEILIERGSLYRDWVDFAGLKETSTEYEHARQAYQNAIALAEQDGYRFPQHYLSASVNLAWLYAQGNQSAEVERIAASLRKFVPSRYQFTTERAPDPDASDATYFRELSKLSVLYAQSLLPKEDRLGRLREHIFSVTGMQLFSPYTTHYLEISRSQLGNFVISNFRTAQDKAGLLDLTAQIVEDYHLDQLRKPLKSLQAEEVICEIAAQQSDEPDYLKD